MTAPTREERERLRRLCLAATPGPWETDGHPSTADVSGPGGRHTIATVWLGEDERGPANAAFIAAARSAVPALLDALEEAEADRDRERAGHEGTKLALQAAGRVLAKVEAAAVEAIEDLHHDSWCYAKGRCTVCDPWSDVAASLNGLGRPTASERLEATRPKSIEEWRAKEGP